MPVDTPVIASLAYYVFFVVDRIAAYTPGEECW